MNERGAPLRCPLGGLVQRIHRDGPRVQRGRAAHPVVVKVGDQRRRDGPMPNLGGPVSEGLGVLWDPARVDQRRLVAGLDHEPVRRIRRERMIGRRQRREDPHAFDETARAEIGGQRDFVPGGARPISRAGSRARRPRARAAGREKPCQRDHHREQRVGRREAHGMQSAGLPSGAPRDVPAVARPEGRGLRCGSKGSRQPPRAAIVWIRRRPKESRRPLRSRPPEDRR